MPGCTRGCVGRYLYLQAKRTLPGGCKTFRKFQNSQPAIRDMDRGVINISSPLVPRSSLGGPVIILEPPAEQPSSNNFEGGATIEQQLWHPSTPFFGGDRRHSYRNRSTPTSKWPACTGTSDATKKPTTMTRKYQLTRTTHPTTKHPTPNKAAQP